jgi:hypothetical protein
MRYLLCLLLAMPGCAGPEKSFKRELDSGRCDEALLNLPERDPLVKLADRSQQAANTVLSYAFVGASYTAEVLLDAAGGTVMFVALCGVPLVLMAAASAGAAAGTGGMSPIGCFPGKLDALSSPPLGRQARKASAEMRCPDLKSLSRSMRAVASCYESRGDLEKARRTLESVKNSDSFYVCLPDAEKDALERQLGDIIRR